MLVTCFGVLPAKLCLVVGEAILIANEPSTRTILVRQVCVELRFGILHEEHNASFSSATSALTLDNFLSSTQLRGASIEVRE